ESSGFEVVRDLYGGAAQLVVGDVGRRDDDLKGSNLSGQPEAVFVVTLLDRGSEDPLDTDAVTAHDRRDFFAIAVKHASAHGGGILVAKFEDVPDFHCRVDAQRGGAIGAGLGCCHAAQISIGGGLEVVARRQVFEMVVLFVGAGDQVLAIAERFVDKKNWASGIL